MSAKEIIPILMYHDISNKINNHSVYYKKFFLQINLLNKLGYEIWNPIIRNNLLEIIK